MEKIVEDQLKTLQIISAQNSENRNHHSHYLVKVLEARLNYLNAKNKNHQ